MKLSLPKLLDTGKLLKTQAGQQLEELITYTSTTMAQVIQSLRGGLNFRDNFDCLIQTVSLSHNTPQVINRGSQSKIVSAVVPMQVVSSTCAIASLVWYIDNANNLVVNPQFQYLDSIQAPVKVVLRIEY